MKQTKQTASNAPQAIPRWSPDARQGLTAAQAAERAAAGLTNRDGSVKTKSIGRIIRDNTCTLFNLVIALLGLAVVLVGSYRNALFVGIMLVNVVIGIVQEIRTKRVIDKLSILSATHVRAVRDGKVTEIAMDAVVLDDVLEFSRGSQIVADCVLLEGECDVNESLLTGEPNAIHKRPGDTLLSGSFLVNGVCRARADQVGAATYVSAISSAARKPKRVNSEIMRSLQRFIRVIAVAIFPVGGLLFWNQYNLFGHNIQGAVVSTTAALVGMIPEGLVLLTSVVLAVSVIRLSKHNVMVQELYCIESLARVDVLCLDKTGTITEGTMELREVLPLNGIAEPDIRRALNTLCTVMQDDTPTFQAICKKYGGSAGGSIAATEILPFSSEKKWSGACLGGAGSLIFGAPEFILRGQMTPALHNQMDGLAQDGRVLLLAHSPHPFPERELPPDIRPLALLLVQDTIRADAPDTLRFFAEQGVRLKVISGDNPVTVSTIARRVGLEDAEKYVDASTLETDADIEHAVQEYAVFGRVSPDQKKRMVNALQRQGHTVAMTGDGVNDVLALKEADCSIAMASGSDAARNVSHLVLLDSNFAALPNVVYEGRRSINNLQRSAALFLAKTIFSICLSVIFVFLPQAYPFQPIQLTLISALAIGFPSFILALEPNKNRVQGGFLRNVIRQAFPGGLTIVLNVLAVTFLDSWLGLGAQEASTLCVLLTAFTGLLVVIRLSLPFNLLRGTLCGLIFAGFLLSFLFLHSFFALIPISLALLGTALPFLAGSLLAFLLFCWVSHILQEKQGRKAAVQLKK